MANAVVTPLGRVQPIYKGNYVHGTEYNLLDNVFYEGSTYVSLIDGNRNHYPTDSNYWQQISSQGARGVQGYTGSFGVPTASAFTVQSGDNPTVNVTASGPDEAKIFDFRFGIPAGPYGFDDIAATVTTLASNEDITVDTELDTSTEERILRFDFGIPAADGQGAQSVDGVMADANNNVNLSAVRYIDQSLSEIQKLIVCNNIGAIKTPSAVAYGNFLKYGGTIDNPTWVTESIGEISYADIDAIVI